MKKPVSKSRKSTSSDTWYPTDAEFAKFRPIAEVDPVLLDAHHAGTLRKRGRPKLDQKKEVVSLRLDPAILEAMRARGQGWQTQLNAFLYKTIVQGKQDRF